MGLGRFFCVALPFILTAISIVCLLIVGLAGVTNSTINIFEISPKDLDISLKQLQNLDFQKKIEDAADKISRVDSDDLSSDILDSIGGISVTAAQLNLGDEYKFYLWNYAEVRGDETTKSDPKLDYASNFTTDSSIAHFNDAIPGDVELPDAVVDGLRAFSTLMKWTQVVFIIAFIATVITVLIGIIGFFSRIGSCVTWIASAISTAAIIGFVALATMTSTAIVAALNATLKKYGVKSSVGVSWLTVAWIGAAASITASIFWLFTICCCASSRNDNRRSRAGDAEKFLGPRGYQPVQDPFMSDPYIGQQSGIYNQQQHAIPMHNVKIDRAQAYEPYSHHAT